ncbi:MAG: hypothetical protein R3E89_14035 [Thiolinea sp.]
MISSSMVAPERTEQGSQALAQQEGSFLSGQLFSVRRIAWHRSTASATGQPAMRLATLGTEL